MVLPKNARKSNYIIFSHRNIPDNLRITIGDHVLDWETCGKFLGVVLDDKLRFDVHINQIACKVSKLIGLLCKLKIFFPSEILRSLYLTLVYPYLNYCILAWGSTNDSHLYPLLIAQKKIVRIISNVDYLEHTRPLFKNLNLLNLKDLFTYHANILMFKIMVLKEYPDFNDRLLRAQTNHRYDTRNDNLRLPFFRTCKSMQCLDYQLPNKWNLLPHTLKCHLSLNSFKVACKRYLISQY